MSSVTTTIFEKNQETWSNWGLDIHNDPEQIQRQNRAKSVDNTPISLSASSGVFRGTKTDYETDLLICSCRDYALRRKPCKHMYRLAYELGVFMFDNVVSDNSASMRKRIDDIMPIVFSLPDDLQILYREICYECGNDNKTSRGYFLNDKTAKIFVDNGLLCAVTDKAKLITHCSVNDIRRILKGLTSDKLPRKGVELFDYALTNFPDIELPLSAPHSYFELPYNISHLAMTIRKRLYDKFPVDHDTFSL